MEARRKAEPRKSVSLAVGQHLLDAGHVALFTSVSFLSLRIRPGALVPIKWRLPECPRLILPLAVNLKRFLAPRWVFNFNFGFDAFLGIAGNPLVNSCCQIMFYPALEPNHRGEERFLTPLRSVRNDGEGERCEPL